MQPDSKFDTPNGADPELRRGLNSRERLLMDLNEGTPRENRDEEENEPYWSE